MVERWFVSEREDPGLIPADIYALISGKYLLNLKFLTKL